LPAVNPFINFVASVYWSSTTSAESLNFAWVVNFNLGLVGVNLKNAGSFVTAVRGGS
jgi:hypothetical protein